MNAAALPVLPADLADALAAAARAAPDGRAELRLRDPRTGATFRLTPAAPEEDRTAERPAGDRPRDGGQSLKEAVDEAIAQADAGLGVTAEEDRRRMLEKFPMLREHWAGRDLAGDWSKLAEAKEDAA